MSDRPNALLRLGPIEAPQPPENALAPRPTWADAYDANAAWLAQQRAISSQRGLWNDATGMPTGAGLVDAGQQYGNALMMGTTAPKGVSPLEQLVARWGAAEKPPYNEGGQQINMFLPDGRVSTADLPDHNMMVKGAGFPGTLHEFMATTGAIRSHGPDNYEVHQKPTNHQIRAMSRYARDDGNTSVWVDAQTGNGMVSDSVPVSRLSAFFDEAFGK